MRSGKLAKLERQIKCHLSTLITGRKQWIVLMSEILCVHFKKQYDLTKGVSFLII